MQSLEGDSAIQWYQHNTDAADVDGSLYKSRIYDEFQKFLLNLIANSANRRLQAYERWEKARQRNDQKMIVFKTYLKNLKSYLSDFSEVHRVNIFLAKLKPELKNKLLSTDNVSENRKAILAQTIMQKRILKRQRNTSGHKNSDKKDNKSDD